MRQLLICAFLMLTPAPLLAEEAARLLTVTGTGDVARSPDMAIIDVGVVHEETSAEAALSRTSEAMQRMQTRLAEEGVEARDIQTTQLSLSPIYDRTQRNDEPPRIVGFRAVNAVTVRVRDLGKTGAVLGALVGDGANRVGGISFTLQDGQEAMDEARRRAVADARRKAELMAEAAGVTLGQVRDIREVGGGRPQPMPMARMASEAMDVPIAEGEVGLNASVTLIYEIE
jgi:uncharacterized protein YggE